jgi:hypothetical protein
MGAVKLLKATYRSEELEGVQWFLEDVNLQRLDQLTPVE